MRSLMDHPVPTPDPTSTTTPEAAPIPERNRSKTGVRHCRSTLHWFKTELLTQGESPVGLMAVNRELLPPGPEADARRPYRA